MEELGFLLCMISPKIPIWNYLNHSKDANLRWENGKGYFARCDIKSGEEIFANYTELGEPKNEMDDYYKPHAS